MCVIEAPLVRKVKVVSDEIGKARIATKSAGWLKKNDGVGGIQATGAWRHPTFENCRLRLHTLA